MEGTETCYFSNAFQETRSTKLLNAFQERLETRLRKRLNAFQERAPASNVRICFGDPYLAVILTIHESSHAMEGEQTASILRFFATRDEVKVFHNCSAAEQLWDR